jgi:hypothetical protein
MIDVPLVLSMLSFVSVTVIGYLQWRTMAKRNASGEALDWSTAAKNLREENKQLRDELKANRQELKAVKELTLRLIKELDKAGEPIILTPVERALLDTSPGMKGPK